MEGFEGSGFTGIGFWFSPDRFGLVFSIGSDWVVLQDSDLVFSDLDRFFRIRILLVFSDSDWSVFSGFGFGRFFQRIGSGFSGSGFRINAWFFYGSGSGIKKGFQG